VNPRDVNMRANPNAYPDSPHAVPHLWDPACANDPACAPAPPSTRTLAHTLGVGLLGVLLIAASALAVVSIAAATIWLSFRILWAVL
jgi:hypothetical protein